MRTYSTIDMIRFARMCKEYPDLKPLDQLKLYNNTVEELLPKQRLDNLMRALGIEIGQDKNVLEKEIKTL